MFRANHPVVLAFCLPVVTAWGGCASGARSTFDLQTPRFYVWTRFDPKEVRESIEAEGVSVEETGDERGGLFIVRGTGRLKWIGGDIIVSENSVTVNGVTLHSAPDSYESALIERSGRVRPGVMPPFEWPVYKLW